MKLALLLGICFLAVASAHPHHGHDDHHHAHSHGQPEGAHQSQLYQEYLNAKASRGFHSRPVNVVVADDYPEGYNKEFFPPLPGQSPVDFHPVLRRKRGPNEPLTYYSWHIHAYFFGGGANPNSTSRAMKFRDDFMKTYNVSLCPDSCFMGGIFDKCNGMCVWAPFYTVDGPHVVPQWGVFLPNELLASTLSWMSANHGEFSILFHPNTGEMIGDHDPMQRAMWISDRYPLDLEFLRWLQCRWFHDECPAGHH